MDQLLEPILSSAKEVQEKLGCTVEGEKVVQVLEDALSSPSDSCEQAAERAKVLIWEHLHGAKRKTAGPEWREAFTVAATLVACAALKAGRRERALRVLDEALLLAGPNKALHSVCTAIHNTLPRITAPPSMKQVHKFDERLPSLDWMRPVPILERADSILFLEECVVKREPHVIAGEMEDWPALKDGKWANMQYFLDRMGWRTVPVEMGFDYLADGWSQNLMHFHTFVLNYLAKGEQAYLAQHQLIDQVHELASDIHVPHFCTLSSDVDHVAVNLWIGPKGTVSRCHFDPKHNLLCQVVGRKRVILFHPQYSESLYPQEQFANTSSILELEKDQETLCKRFPKFRDVKATVCTLYPGQMLYIPPGHWHYVRSLDQSISVSFWW